MVTASHKILRAESYLLLNCILIHKEWLETDPKQLYKKELSIAYISEEMSRESLELACIFINEDLRVSLKVWG